MKSLLDRSLVVSDAGILKMARRRRASVVLPDELGPDSPIIRARSVALSLDIALDASLCRDSSTLSEDSLRWVFFRGVL